MYYMNCCTFVVSESNFGHGFDLQNKAGSDSRPLSTSPEVGQIIEDIDVEKHSRLRKEIKEELTSIKDRVKEVKIEYMVFQKI